MSLTKANGILRGLCKFFMLLILILGVSLSIVSVNLYELHKTNEQLKLAVNENPIENVKHLIPLEINEKYEIETLPPLPKK